MNHRHLQCLHSILLFLPLGISLLKVPWFLKSIQNWVIPPTKHVLALYVTMLVGSKNNLKVRKTKKVKQNSGREPRPKLAYPHLLWTGPKLKKSAWLFFRTRNWIPWQMDWILKRKSAKHICIKKIFEITIIQLNMAEIKQFSIILAFTALWDIKIKEMAAISKSHRICSKIQISS